jgi:hypothetical protein
LEAELKALPSGIEVISYGADEVLARLPISSKFNAGDAFIATLFESGRSAAVTRRAAE